MCWHKKSADLSLHSPFRADTASKRERSNEKAEDITSKFIISAQTFPLTEVKQAIENSAI